MRMLESFNSELDHLSIIEKQLLKDVSVSSTILAMRRKNALSMANFCKYEQELKTEFEYGRVEYDINRLKIHEQKRDTYIRFVEECTTFRIKFYMLVRKYQSK